MAKRDDYIYRNKKPLWYAAFARPLSKLWGLCVAIRNFGYDVGWLVSRPLKGTVISVGNIAVGGTGKTPTVIWLCEYLCKQGYKPAILSRGYGTQMRSKGVLFLLNGQVLHGEQVEDLPDEAYMQSIKLPTVPVIVGKKRYQAAQAFCQQHPDHLITHWVLDDGFQHRKIRRNLDIVLLDSALPWGHDEAMLPYGFLREPVASLMRADIVIFTRATARLPLNKHRMRVEKLIGGPVIKSYMKHFNLEPVNALACKDDIQERKQAGFLLFSAIARSEQLITVIEQLNLKVVHSIIKLDHQKCTRKEIEPFIEKNMALLITEKDYYRQRDFFNLLEIPVYTLPMAITFDDGALKLLQNRVNKVSQQKGLEGSLSVPLTSENSPNS